MTPEQIENAEREIRKWFPPQTDAETPSWRRALELLVSSATAAIPSGQVAEDDRKVRVVLDNVHAGSMTTGAMAADARDTHARLAAQAQSAETYRDMWETATRELGALSSTLETVRRERDEAKEQARLGWERAAEKDRAYGDMISQRDAREREVLLHFDAKNAALAEVVALKSRVAASTRDVADAARENEAMRRYIARAVETLGGQPGEDLQHCAERVRYEWTQTAERCARLSAAGQVLSEYVDSAAGSTECDGEPDCGWHNGGPCKACTRAMLSRLRGDPPPTLLVERETLSVRDEFAKAAMQALTIAGGNAMSRESITSAAYLMADTMLKERAKP